MIQRRRRREYARSTVSIGDASTIMSCNELASGSFDNMLLLLGHGGHWEAMLLKILAPIFNDGVGVTPSDPQHFDWYLYPMQFQKLQCLELHPLSL